VNALPGRVIAVLGCKGSPGVTFVAAGLACRLAAAGVDVLAVDADAEDRSLAVHLDVTRADPEGLARSASLGLLTGDLIRHLAAAVAPRLWLVEVRDGDGVDGRAIVTAARDGGFAAVVCDLGHQVGPLQRQVLACTDWLLWPVIPDRVGLERADRALASRAAGSSSCGLVLNRMGRTALKGADHALAERHQLPVMARFRDDASAAGRISAARPAHRTRPFRRPFDELARAVHPRVAPAVRGTWP
jgi:cellulose biosynthesis protein BcsQ